MAAIARHDPAGRDPSPLAILGCVSHSPLIAIRPKAPPEEVAVMAHCDAFRAQVDAFEPEQIVFFVNDHFAGFHYSNMPAYCVGTACTAVADLGGQAGPIPVNEADAVALVAFLRDEGFDPAISYKMTVDHAMSQPLNRLIGGIDRVPVLPVFISVFTPPLMRFRRSRLLGEAVGRFIARQGKRTIIMASGGISHHPAHYFPMMGTAPDDVHGYQLDGARGGTMTDDEWFGRFTEMHERGAQLTAERLRTADDMRFNADFDHAFLAALTEERLSALDELDQDEVVEQAGVGALELHMWIAAASAFRAVEGSKPLTTYYAPIVEYCTAYAMAYSGLSARG